MYACALFEDLIYGIALYSDIMITDALTPRTHVTKMASEKLPQSQVQQMTTALN